VPAVRRKIDAVRSVEEHVIANGDAPDPRSAQSGDRIERGRLSRSRGAEQGGDAAVQLFVQFEKERALLKREVQRDHALTPARVVMKFERASAANAMTADTTTSAAASASRPVSAKE